MLAHSSTVPIPAALRVRTRAGAHPRPAARSVRRISLIATTLIVAFVLINFAVLAYLLTPSLTDHYGSDDRGNGPSARLPVHSLFKQAHFRSPAVVGHSETHAAPTIGVIAPSSTSPFYRALSQSALYQSPSLTVHIGGNDSASHSMELFLSMVIKHYHRLPDILVSIGSALPAQSIDAVVAYLVQRANDKQNDRQFVNLQPGDYQCHTIVDYHVIMGGESVDLPVTKLNVSRPIRLDTANLLVALTQPQSAPASMPPVICADVSQHFVVSKASLLRYTLAQYQSMLRLYRSYRTAGGIGSSSDSAQCELQYLVPLLYTHNDSGGESHYFQPPLLYQHSHYHYYHRHSLITDSVRQSLSLEPLSTIGLSSRHPLYKRITNPHHKHYHHSLIVIPSTAQKDAMARSQTVAQESERWYEWLRLMPMGLDPPSVQFNIIVHDKMIQRHNDSYNAEAIAAVNDNYTQSLLAQRAKMLRVDAVMDDTQYYNTGTLMQCQSGSEIVSGAAVFVQYLLNHWNYYLKASCVFTVIQSYHRYHSNDTDTRTHTGSGGDSDSGSVYDDRLSVLLRYKWNLAQSAFFLPFNFDRYRCAYSHTHNDSDSQRVQDARAELFHQLFPQYHDQYPSVLCYYSGGEFLVSRFAIIKRPKSFYDNFLLFLCKFHQQLTRNYVSLTASEISSVIDRAMEPLWQMIFLPSKIRTARGDAVTTVMDFHYASQFLLTEREISFSEKFALTPVEYNGLVSHYDRNIELLMPPVVADPFSAHNHTVNDRAVTVAVVVAAYDETVTFINGVTANFTRVLVRQSHLPVPGERSFALNTSTVTALTDSDATITDLTVLSDSRGMCKEGSSYLKYIVQYYDRLPDYSLFVHGSSRSWHHQSPLEDVLNHLDWDYILAHTLTDGGSGGGHFYYNLNSGFYTLVRPDHWLVLARHVYEMIGTNHTHNSRHFFRSHSRDTLPELIGFHQAAQFVVSADSIRRNTRAFYIDLYEWCRFTTLSPVMASRLLEYSWHWLLGEPMIEPRHECGVISARENCTLNTLGTVKY